LADGVSALADRGDRGCAKNEKNSRALDASRGGGVGGTRLALQPREPPPAKSPAPSAAIDPGPEIACVTVPFALPEPARHLAAPVEPAAGAGPLSRSRWLDAIGWTPAHRALSRGRRVGLVDRAVDPTSPLLPGGARVLRYRFAEDGLPERDGSPGDGQDHGTRSAAAILAVAPEAELHAFALPAAFRRGAGSPLALVVAICELARRGVDVICVNASSRRVAGFVNAHAAPEAAIDALRGHLAELDYYRAVGQLLATSIVDAPLIVAGTGNDSRPGIRLPASQPAASWGAVAVGALDREHAVSAYSHGGAHLVAPGDVALDDRGQPFRGTSAAAAITAGAAALWAGRLGLDGDRERLRAHLIAHARRDRVAGEPDSDDVGAGVVQVPPLP
jgi:hypothetical protein